RGYRPEGTPCQPIEELSLLLMSSNCASAGFVLLFAFFLESFAHLLLARKLEFRSLLASHLTGGSGNPCCRGFNRDCYQTRNCCSNEDTLEHLLLHLTGFFSPTGKLWLGELVQPAAPWVAIPSSRWAEIFQPVTAASWGSLPAPKRGSLPLIRAG